MLSHMPDKTSLVYMRQANCIFHATIVDFVWYTLIWNSLSPFVCFFCRISFLIKGVILFYFYVKQTINLFFIIIVCYLLVFVKEVTLWIWHCSNYQMYGMQMVNLQQQSYAYQTSIWITFQSTSPWAYICYQVYRWYQFVNSVFLETNQLHS